MVLRRSNSLIWGMTWDESEVYIPGNLARMISPTRSSWAEFK